MGINFHYFSTKAHQIYYQYGTIIHEVFHIMGFSDYWFGRIPDPAKVGGFYPASYTMGTWTIGT
jgi:Leishmanolysin